MTTALGWVLIVGGFAWIAMVSAMNPSMSKTMWSDEMEHYREERNYSRQEVFEAMRAVGRSVSAGLLSPLWGGLAMLAGAGLIGRRAEKKNP